MGVTLTVALGVLSSYIAGNIPTIKELFTESSIKNKLDDYYRKAVGNWNVALGRKDAAANNMQQHLDSLQAYILDPAKGIHPEEKELLRLWAEYVLSDADCCIFIVKNQQVLFHNKEFDAINTANILLKDIINDQKNKFDEISGKLDSLLKRGSEKSVVFWNRKSHAEGLTLTYDTILAGREDAKYKVLAAIHTPLVLFLEADSQQEAMAFAAASLLSSEDEFCNQRTIIVTNQDVYNEVEQEKNGYIIITPLAVNPWVAQQAGNSVIRCMSKSERGVMDGKITLPTLDRGGFVDALEKSGFAPDRARRLAVDVSLDVNFLWRTLKIETNNPTWADQQHIRTLIPVMLIGEWDEGVKNDREILSILSGSSYEEYFEKLQFIIYAEESPLLKIGSVWQIKAPYTLYNLFYRDITDNDIKHFLECIEWLLEDDDPDALAKMDEGELKCWKDRHAYSGYIKRGVFRSLTLLSIVFEKYNRDNKAINKLIQSQLDGFTTERYLSNMHNMKWIAEANPAAFLDFIQKDIASGAQLMDKIFEIKQIPYSLTDANIFYSDLLFCLESIAWSRDLLPQATDILLYLCKYQNGSNWTNRPINTLYNIYQFLLPQTFADFDNRFTILKSLSTKYPEAISTLCIRILKGLEARTFFPTARFQWRWAELYKEQQCVFPMQEEHVRQVLTLSFELCKWTKDEISTFIELSTIPYMFFVRATILDAIKGHIDTIKNDEATITQLRKIIDDHTAMREAYWAMCEIDLTAYKELLKQIEPQDIITQTKPYFENIFYNYRLLGIKDSNYADGITKTRELRAQKLQSLHEQLGIDGIWNLLTIVKSPEALAEGFAEWSNDSYYSIVYEKYCNGEIPMEFVRKYFLLLYFKNGKDTYSKIVDKLNEINENKIAIVLYAPEYQSELASYAESKSQEIYREYWQNVTTGFISDEHVANVVRKLFNVERYDDILVHFCGKERLALIPNDDKVNLLCDLFNSGRFDILHSNIYQVAEFLENITLENGTSQKNTILLLELSLFESLQHYLHGNKMHLIKEINDNPEFLMQIVKYKFLPDEGGIENIDRPENVGLIRVVWEFWYYYRSVPCTNDDGVIDEQKLKEYIYTLKALASKYRHEKSISYVIGKILGNLPEGDDYPTDMMCEIVEDLNDDAIDSEMRTCIFNKRGATSRSVFEGGTVEQHNIKIFEEYKRRAQLRSHRLCVVFDKLIQEYKAFREWEDNQAMHNRLEL